MTEHEISQLVQSDKWMMDVLQTAEKLNLPDWWIGAGFLRNRVWDAIEGNPSVPSRDIDLVYFDAKNIQPETDWHYDKIMEERFPSATWEIRNQARMHYVNDFEPYTSTADGISHWVETATCVAVKLERGKVKLLFCHGIHDLANLIARPTPAFQTNELIDTFHKRVESKGWRKRWPHLKVLLR